MSKSVFPKGFNLQSIADNMDKERFMVCYKGKVGFDVESAWKEIEAIQKKSKPATKRRSKKDEDTID